MNIKFVSSQIERIINNGKIKEYLEIINLIRKNEGEKFIYKKLKRFIAAKKISIAEYVELNNFFEDKETTDFSAFVLIMI